MVVEQVSEPLLRVRLPPEEHEARLTRQILERPPRKFVAVAGDEIGGIASLVQLPADQPAFEALVPGLDVRHLEVGLSFRPQQLPNPRHRQPRIRQVLEHVPQANQVVAAGILGRGRHLEEVGRDDGHAEHLADAVRRLRRKRDPLHLPARLLRQVQQASVAAADVDQPARRRHTATNELEGRVLVVVAPIVVVPGIDPLLGVLRLIQSRAEIEVDQPAVRTLEVPELAIVTLTVVEFEPSAEAEPALESRWVHDGQARLSGLLPLASAMIATLPGGLRALLAAVAAVLLPTAAGAEPWLAPGDVALRSDLATLADSGALQTPLTAWPLAWADIDAGLRAIDAAELDGYALGAYRRVLSRAEAEAGAQRVTGYARLAFAEHPWVIRTFADTPREDAQLTGGFTFSNDRFTVRVNATRAWDPADEDTFRPDGSYVGVGLGNWTLSLGYP